MHRTLQAISKKLHTLSFLLIFCATAICAEGFQNPMPSQLNNLPLIPPKLRSHSFVLIDANSGQVLIAQSANTRLPPASLTKLMTLYIISKALSSGQIHLNDSVYISKNAWSQTGSRLFLNSGSRVPVSTLIQGIVVASGNDACVAMAEYIGGNEENFAQLMNEQALKLGMQSTHFIYSTGLPHPEHYTTAADLATLARALIRDYPQYYTWYKQKWITYSHIKQANRNLLLWRDPSIDGLKTGHTDAAGYCLIASSLREKMRLIAVVLHSPSEEIRLQDTQALLNWGYQHYKTYTVFQKNTPITPVALHRGQIKTVTLGVKNTLYVTVPLQKYKQIKAWVTLPSASLIAPIVQDNIYGTLTLSLEKKVLQSVPLIALASTPKIAWFQRPWEYISLLLHK